MSHSYHRPRQWFGLALLLAISVITLTTRVEPRSAAPPVSQLEQPVETTASTAPSTPDCDPMTLQMRRMFTFLAHAALANAGKSQGDIQTGVAEDRVTFERDLDAIGLSTDESDLDAAFGVGLLTGTDKPTGC